MDELIQEQLKRLKQAKKRRIRWLSAFLALALLVTLVTTDALTLSGEARVYTERVLACSYTPHAHTAECYNEAGELICGQADYVLHAHNADCYDYEGKLVCPLPEIPEHTHSEACYEERLLLVCEEDTQGHVHTDACYDWPEETVLTEEGEELIVRAEEPVLVCGLAEGEGAHVHTEECWELERTLTCGLEEHQRHSHSAECYNEAGELVCGKLEVPVHIHGSGCLKTVELSKEEVALRGLAEAEAAPARKLTGDWSEDLPAVAASQLGYVENADDLGLGADGVERPYTVYGDWYGDPYGAWNGAFVAWCLNEAGIPAARFARHSDPAAWQRELELAKNWFDPFAEAPLPGDLVFLRLGEAEDEAETPAADHVAIVTGFGLEQSGELMLRVVEAAEGEVRESAYAAGDARVLGFARLPREDEDPAYPAQSFEELCGGVRVTVRAESGAFPAGTEMVVTPVETEEIMDAVSGAVESASEELRVQAVDIAFYNEAGEEIEPLRPIRVTMAAEEIAQQENPVVVHVDAAGEAQVMETKVPAQLDEAPAEDELVFDAGGFSVYAIVYTVDFRFEVNGKEFKFRLSGGDGISFSALAELLGIAADDPATEEDELWDFVTNVESVVFSDPALLWVGAVPQDMSLGALKQSAGLSCAYSAELTAEQIAEMNEQMLAAGDWALVSLAPFTTHETLAVTMTDGEVFTVEVTDAQLRETYISDSGETWEITVEYTDEAEIPATAELWVKELLPGDEGYEEHYLAALREAGVSAEDEAAKAAYARFFDIEIWDGETRLEPAAPVSVSIRLLDLPRERDAVLTVVHFAQAGLDVMEAEETEGTAETELRFTADEFSIYGILGMNKVEEAEGRLGRTTADNVAIRESAFLLSAKVATIPAKGTLVSVLGTANGILGGLFTHWYYISYTDGEGAIYTGYVEQSQIRIVEMAELEPVEYDSFTATLSFEAGALPEGTALAVSAATVDEDRAEAYRALIEAQLVAGDGNKGVRGSVKAIEYFDMSLLADGREVQPEGEVCVGLALKTPVTLGEGETLRVVHFTGEGAAIVLPESKVELTEDASGAVTRVSFFTDGFSTYALARVIELDYLAADGNTYHIEVVLDEREVLGGEAELSVSELLEDVENYEHYLFAVSESMMLESVDEIQFVRFFDIKILVDGSAVEPVYPVRVRITYDDPITLGENQAVSVVHFANSGTEVIRDVTLSEDGKALSYQQDSFSVSATVVASNNLVDGRQYVIYTSVTSGSGWNSSTNYYAITHTSAGAGNNLVSAASISGSTTNNAITIDGNGSNIIWTAHKVTVGGDTYWTFSYEEDGKTYYLRSYDGLMVGANDDVDESGYDDEGSYEWRIANYSYTYYNWGRPATGTVSNTLRTYSNRNDDDYIRYSSGGFAEQSVSSSNLPSSFYFAKVNAITRDWPTIHYVDENGNELAVVNGRDWDTDTSTSPAFLIYDIEGYEYVKTTLEAINGTEIRPILRTNSGKWQYTTSTTSSISWTNIPKDSEDSDRLEDIYVVYKEAETPVTGGTPKLKEVQSGELEDPEITKSSTVNDDGTNTLALSVTGHTKPLEVEKLADVIVIVDTSYSMHRYMGTSTTTHGTVGTPVTQLDHNTRLYIAADAVKDLAELLIGDDTTFKNSNNEKLIRMSLISFDRDADIECNFTDDYSTFETAVNGLKTYNGTNWEAALDMANHMTVDPERATFVIFVTDGNPSYRVSRGNLLELEGYPETVSDANVDVYSSNSYYVYRDFQYFGALDEDDPRNYNTAAEVAKSIVAYRKNLYSIGIGNSAGITRLVGLMSDAYNDTTIGAERTKTADSEEELTQAFSDIAASIVGLMGYSDIQISDGITALTQTVQKSTLVNFAEDDFTYYKGHAATAEDVAAGRAAAVGDMVWVSWTPSTENCNEAVYNAETGAVEWNMGTNFMPQEGYTYQVRFKVWPSQAAYDLLADLNNGVKSYSELTDAEKAQISEPATPGGMYTLKTNSETSYTYCEASKSGDTITVTGEPSEPESFDDVDPLKLTTKPLKIKKQWHNNYVDSRGLTDHITMQLYGVNPDGSTSDFKEITLRQYYYVDGHYVDKNTEEALFYDSLTGEYKTAEGTVGEPKEAENPWYAENNYISYGLVTYDTTTHAGEKIYETGHDFTLRETDDEAHYYELTAGVYGPWSSTVPPRSWSVWRRPRTDSAKSFSITLWAQTIIIGWTATSIETRSPISCLSPPTPTEAIWT